MDTPKGRYTGWLKLKDLIPDDAEVLDIPTMRKLAIDEYASYVDGDLFFTDSHGVLRATAGEHPIACTKDQVDSLIAYLGRVRQQIDD